MRLACLFLVCVCLSGCSTNRAVRISAANPEQMARLVAEIRRAPLVVVGEFHDRSSHHELQLNLIKHLEAQGVPVVIGLEMFDLASQPALDRWSKGELDLAEFTRLYQQNWTISWTEYDQILLYARNRRLPLIGLNAPQDLVIRVSRYGWQSLRAEDRARLPVGVTAATTADYRDFLGRSFHSHAIDPALFDHFCAAQGLRNNTMALLIKQALAEHPGATMVVITGVGHAIRRGIAAALDPELAARTRIIVPDVDGLFTQLDEQDVDYIVTE
jgi:uncharacterized iron-regulated protein